MLSREISQVNETLTWMESHPFPFACTTNFAEALDPASLRRFVFKVKLDCLNAEQAEQAFPVFFGLEPPSGLAAMRILTPGDFAVVHREKSAAAYRPRTRSWRCFRRSATANRHRAERSGSEVADPRGCG